MKRRRTIIIASLIVVLALTAIGVFAQAPTPQCRNTPTPTCDWTPTAEPTVTSTPTITPTQVTPTFDEPTATPTATAPPKNVAVHTYYLPVVFSWTYWSGAPGTPMPTPPVRGTVYPTVIAPTLEME